MRNQKYEDNQLINHSGSEEDRLSGFNELLGAPSQTLKNIGKLWIKLSLGYFWVKLSTLEFFNYKNLKLIKFIKRNLVDYELKWILLHTDSDLVVFSLFQNQILIWNAIPKNIAMLFLSASLHNPMYIKHCTDRERLDSYHNGFRVITIVNDVVRKSSSEEIQINSLKFNLIELLHPSTFINVYNQVLLSFESIQIKNPTQSTNSELKRFINRLKQSSLSKDFPSLKYVDLLGLTPTHLLESPPIRLNLDKMRGQYFTPLELSFTLVNYSLMFSKVSSISSYSEFAKVKILDPASGTGMILFVALECIINQILLLNEKSPFDTLQVLRKNIFFSVFYGYDIDERIVAFSRNFVRLLMLMDEEISDTEWNLNNMNFLTNMTEMFRKRIASTSYDLILSNPPYIPFSGRFAKQVISQENRNILLEMIPKFMGKRENLYILFLGLALRYASCKQHGIVGFVLDHSFLDLSSYSDLRKMLADNYKLVYLLEDYTYRKAVVDLSILIFQNTKPKNKDSVKYLAQKSLNYTPKDEYLIYFNEHPNFIYKIYRRAATRDLINHIHSRSVKLGEVSQISCGLEYGSLLRTHFLSQNKSSGMYRVIDGANGLPQSFITFWVPDMKNSYVRFSKEYEEYLRKNNLDRSDVGNKKVLLISGEKRRFTEPKIFLRQTASKFILSYDTKGYFGLRNLHTIHKFKPPYTPYLIMGILTSSLGYWIGQELNIIRSTGAEGNRYPQIRIKEMRSFPIINLEERKSASDSQRIKQVELKVKECLHIGEQIETIYSKIWEKIVHHTPDKSLSSQKRLFYYCRNPEKFSFLPRNIRMDINFLLKELHKHQALIEHNQGKINEIVLKIYGITQEQWEQLF